MHRHAQIKPIESSTKADDSRAVLLRSTPDAVAASSQKFRLKFKNRHKSFLPYPIERKKREEGNRLSIIQMRFENPSLSSATKLVFSA
ncbi:hypothetical protein Trydic_g16136 [Trypoxylus dichotomus]